MFVKITNGKVDQYPYTIGNLRRDNPSISFPREIPNEMLSEFNVFPVTLIDSPGYNYTKNIKEFNPILIDGVWTQNWQELDASQEEIDERILQLEKVVRAKRNNLLAQTDHYGLSDRSMTTNMSTYRQDLRDITAHVNFPHLSDEDWPTKPAE